MKKELFQKLVTAFEEDNFSSWESEYPNPLMKRERWMPLSGEWELFVKNKNEEYIGKIKVPYPPESRISEIERQLEEGEVYIYKKSFTLPEKFELERVLLHFGAVDTICTVFLNDSKVCEHEGGYLPFKADITPYLKEGENLLKVEVVDNLDITMPYGKQKRDRGGMWYTPISGIWQMVWLENVCQEYISKIKITPSLSSVVVETTGGSEEKKIIIGEREIEYSGDKVTINIENPVNWTPENPYLYDFTIISGEDRVQSYFALREIGIESGYITLNKKPYYFHGVLDQGYFSDGIFTPKTPQGYICDILTMKKLGFNMLRKHIKIEPALFYHYCDKYGMIVFQDMVNSGKYSYILDTVLPTIGLKFSIDRKIGKKQKYAFEKAIEDTVTHLYNHPSVCYWTVFNEGWGQFEADRIYKKVKKLDNTRVWDMTSGWFKKKNSDVDSEHIYFRKIKLKRKGDRPLILSEFGGYSYKIDEHSFNLSKTYGYKKFTDKESYTKAIEALYYDEIIPSIKMGLGGSVITQLSDVEDETNGFVTYDRRVVKTDERVMQSIKDEIDKTFKEVLDENLCV